MTIVALSPAPVTDIGDWARGNGLEIVLIVLGAVLLGRVIRWASDHITTGIDTHGATDGELVRSEAVKHRHALAQVISWSALALIYSIAAVLVVVRFGVPVTGFVAPATVAGVALGFGAQRIVQDLLAGFFLITERQYGFGDLIKISVIGVTEPLLGTVEDVSLRITTVRSVNGEVIITPNGQIVQVTNLSRDWARVVIDVPVPLSLDVTRISEVLRDLGRVAFSDSELHPLLLDAPSVMGVESIEKDVFTVRMVARTLPGRQFEVGRALRLRITQRFLAEGINVQAGIDTAQPRAAAS